MERLLPALTLPSTRRRDFAWPRGLLCRGNACLAGLPRHAPLACIGDVVSMHCLDSVESGVVDPATFLLVFDGKTRRSEGVPPLEEVLPSDVRLWSTVNPPGTIAFPALHLLCFLARGGGRHAIRVAGEEDMLALPAIECMPEGSTVVYGVPGRGMAIIRVSRERRIDAWLRHTYLVPGLV